MGGLSKNVVITGVSRGIGQALAEEYLSRGWRVSGCSRSAPDELPQNKDFHFCSLDVSDNEQVGDWVKEVAHKYGAPQILINNAGVINRPAPMWEIPSLEFDRLIDINIKGVANVLRGFLPPMFKNSAGLIINMSSGWGRRGEAEVSSYCASKFAVEGLTQSLAKELPQGFIAISLSPGMVKTQMLRDCAPDHFAEATDAQAWAKAAVTFIEQLEDKNNGQSLSCHR